MDLRLSEATHAVALAFQHLGIEVAVEGDKIRLAASGDLIDVHVDDPGVGVGVGQIVVRDRVTGTAAHRFREAGIGWLDLSGHLAYRSPALVIDADVPGQASRTSHRRTSVLAGPVVSGVTIAALLAWPEPLDGVRATARILDVTAGGVSAASIRLQAAGYLTSDLRATPALFWAAAEEWRPKWIRLPLKCWQPGLGPLDTEVVAVGAVAASRIGAPAAVTASTVPEFLVGSATILRYAEVNNEIHPAVGEPVGRFAVAPAPIAVTSTHHHGDVDGHPIANEAIVALTLAIDAARGAETVQSWEGSHVWQ